ncbi:MAG TPA: GxxExxY protein, partial [Bryobacteraceae bacterium]|nr:GxxExxY protein [Bryobacteraceae bacterium]
ILGEGLSTSTDEGIGVVGPPESVGDYLADLVVESAVVIEVKCVEGLAPEHVAQCINYLKASGMKRGLLLNFQKPRLEWKRLVYEF